MSQLTFLNNPYHPYHPGGRPKIKNNLKDTDLEERFQALPPPRSLQGISIPSSLKGKRVVVQLPSLLTQLYLYLVKKFKKLAALEESHEPLHEKLKFLQEKSVYLEGLKKHLYRQMGQLRGLMGLRERAGISTTRYRAFERDKKAAEEHTREVEKQLLEVHKDIKHIKVELNKDMDGRILEQEEQLPSHQEALGSLLNPYLLEPELSPWFNLDPHSLLDEREYRLRERGFFILQEQEYTAWRLSTLYFQITGLESLLERGNKIGMEKSDYTFLSKEQVIAYRDRYQFEVNSKKLRLVEAIWREETGIEEDQVFHRVIKQYLAEVSHLES